MTYMMDADVMDITKDESPTVGTKEEYDAETECECPDDNKDEVMLHPPITGSTKQEDVEILSSTDDKNDVLLTSETDAVIQPHRHTPISNIKYEIFRVENNGQLLLDSAFTLDPQSVAAGRRKPSDPNLRKLLQRAAATAHMATRSKKKKTHENMTSQLLQPAPPIQQAVLSDERKVSRRGRGRGRGRGSPRSTMKNIRITKVGQEEYDAETECECPDDNKDEVMLHPPITGSTKQEDVEILSSTDDKNDVLLTSETDAVIQPHRHTPISNIKYEIFRVESNGQLLLDSAFTLDPQSVAAGRRKPSDPNLRKLLQRAAATAHMATRSKKKKTHENMTSQLLQPAPPIQQAVLSDKRKVSRRGRGRGRGRGSPRSTMKNIRITKVGQSGHSTCRTCGLEFKTYNDKKKHKCPHAGGPPWLSQKHPNQGTVQPFPEPIEERMCPVCSLILTSAAIMEQHRTKCRKVVYGCPNCGLREDTNEDLIKHQRMCDKYHRLMDVEILEYLEPNLSSSEDDETNLDKPCPGCGRRQKTLSQKQAHLRKCRRGRVREKCGVCSKSFVSKVTLHKHRTFCSNYKRHMLQKELDWDSDEEEETSNLACEQCGRCLKTNFGMEWHMKLCRPPPIACSICGVMHNWRPARLRIHEKACTLRKKKSQCSFCGTPCPGASLKPHEVLCSQKRKSFPCSMCGHHFDTIHKNQEHATTCRQAAPIQKTTQGQASLCSPLNQHDESNENSMHDTSVETVTTSSAEYLGHLANCTEMTMANQSNSVAEEPQGCAYSETETSMRGPAEAAVSPSESDVSYLTKSQCTQPMEDAAISSSKPAVHQLALSQDDCVGHEAERVTDDPLVATSQQTIPESTLSKQKTVTDGQTDEQNITTPDLSKPESQGSLMATGMCSAKLLRQTNLTGQKTNKNVNHPVTISGVCLVEPSPYVDTPNSDIPNADTPKSLDSEPMSITADQVDTAVQLLMSLSAASPSVHEAMSSSASSPLVHETVRQSVTLEPSEDNRSMVATIGPTHTRPDRVDSSTQPTVQASRKDHPAMQISDLQVETDAQVNSEKSSAKDKMIDADAPESSVGLTTELQKKSAQELVSDIRVTHQSEATEPMHLSEQVESEVDSEATEILTEDVLMDALASEPTETSLQELMNLTADSPGSNREEVTNNTNFSDQRADMSDRTQSANQASAKTTELEFTEDDKIECFHTKEGNATCTKPIFKCPMCSFGTCTKENLDLHLNKHKQENPFMCYSCDSSFPSNTLLQIHMLKHAKDVLAGSKRNNSGTLNVPMYDTDIASTNKALLPHFQKAIVKKKIASVYGIVSLDGTMRPHQCFVCKLCGISFFGRFTMVEHIANWHLKGDNTCKICGKVSKLPGIADDHARSHIRDEVKCDVCDKVFMNKKRLEHHTQRMHGPTPEAKNHLCDICGHKSKNSVTYAAHRKTHEAAKPYRCKICDKGFVRSDYLTKHLKSHLKDEDRPFKCENCGKGFTRKPYLKLHIDKKICTRPGYKERKEKKNKKKLPSKVKRRKTASVASSSSDDDDTIEDTFDDDIDVDDDENDDVDDAMDDETVEEDDTETIGSVDNSSTVSSSVESQPRTVREKRSRNVSASRINYNEERSDWSWKESDFDTEPEAVEGKLTDNNGNIADGDNDIENQNDEFDNDESDIDENDNEENDDDNNTDDTIIDNQSDGNCDGINGN